MAMPKIGYLGPAGTFTGQAAAALLPEGQLIPIGDIDSVFESVAKGLCDVGVVPVENSTEGSVNATLDALLREEGMNITALLTLPVRHALLALKEAKNAEKILAHPQALAQCRGYIRRHFPKAELVQCASNGEAAIKVAESGKDWAAIGPFAAAQVYGLCVKAEDIQDVASNSTSFIQIEKLGIDTVFMPAKSEYRTSIAFSVENRPGSLYRMLGILESYAINMTKILSRPRPEQPGEYIFFVDIEDYDIESAVPALTLIKSKATMYKFLGSYSISKF